MCKTPLRLTTVQLPPQWLSLFGFLPLQVLPYVKPLFIGQGASGSGGQGVQAAA